MNQIETALTWLAKVDTLMMVSKKLPIIGLQVVVVFGTQKGTIVTE